ncbi:zinc ribbon domain-containing protein [Salinilacihabitans rarus]|uniref:zinc ribbon domain-containing protein n=1 Tax=Salinilacihabitans rarus TaxID=2961596 RepID=UPI0020C86DA1|nr:zinc ribbon domain-containing protein [Salinilacihabitans rarus]
MELLWALAILLVLAFAPTACFLLLLRGLEYLRDDALIQELQATHDLEVTHPLDAGGRSDSSDGATLVTCPACGSRTPAAFEVCVVCDARRGSPPSR